MSRLQIQFIETRCFQRFGHGVRVEGLGPGLNVIAGPNEEGKSTLLRSLRAALFERHKSQPLVEEFRTLGQSVDPEVRVGLRINDVDYEVYKVFSQRVSGRTLLQSSDGTRWQNEDAEHRLEELLGFTHASRGRSRSELQGSSGLLWVTQGEAFHAVSPRDEHLRLLHGTLDGNITQMLGGSDGDRLHARIVAAHDALFDKRGNPRGELRAAQEALERGGKALQAAHAELLAHQGKADALAEKQARLDTFAEDRILERAAGQRDGAQHALDRVRDRRQQVEDARRGLELEEAHLAQANAAWKARQDAIKAARDSAEAREHSHAELLAAQQGLEAMQPAMVAARVSHERARTALQECEARARLLERWLEREQTAASHERVHVQLEAAERAAGERRALDAEHAAIGVDRAMMNEMEDLSREQDRITARLEAGAARLEFQLEPGLEMLLDDAPVHGEGTVHVLTATRLQIAGVGRFTVRPGSLATQPSTSTQRLAGRLQDLLTRAGVRDVHSAREALRRKEAVAARMELLTSHLGVHAPRGLDALRDEEARLAHRLGDLGTELDGTRRPDGDRESMRRLRESARSAAEEAASQLRSVEAEVNRLGTRVVEARSSYNHLQRDGHARDGELSSARNVADDDALARAVADRGLVVRAGRQELDALVAALAADDPNVVELEARRTREAYEGARLQRETLQEECNTLRIELRTLGQQGLAEQVAELQVTRDQAQRRVQDVDRRAQGLKLLHQVMGEALKRAKHSVSRPILQRLGPYMEKVIPGAVPVIDENLALQGLTREDQPHEFQLLSMGTREQIAVLTRLAYADALAEAGEPVCVVLDDALVNTDDERLERMLSVLYQASRNYQVVVLTCHARAWVHAGGKLLHLQDCRLEQN